ncbi:hypothetical protein [Brumimicrobium salinarum]|nr:hypothetical protein [Brumimicrobium salinarum]
MKLPFIGIAGYNSWPGYTPFKFTHENDNVTMAPHIYDMWKTTIRVKNHMNGEDVINTLSDTWGGWKHGMGKAENDGIFKKYAVEQQNYISSNKKMAVGYVYNRTYNVKTRGIGSPCSNINMDPKYNTPRNTEWNYVKNSEQLRVTNLKTHTKYRIYWYSAFRAGDGYLKSDCIETNKKMGTGELP